MKLTYKEYLSIALILAVIGILGVLFQRPWQASGSVAVGNQYQSTTTPQVANRTNLCPARSGMASSTTGVLGAVNVLNANTSAFTIYDATTTNLKNEPGGNSARAATSSLILAEFPANPTEASYHFDIEFKQGLLVDSVTPGAISTTTISYRCEG